MSAEIIQFARPVSRLPKILSEQDLREIDRKVRASAEEPETPREMRIRERQEAPPATESGKNQRLRLQRRDVWWDAEAATRWARALLDFDNACESAQRHGFKDSFAYTPADRGDRMATWRAALMDQLLTPAPDANAITWKHRTFASGQHQHTAMKPERIERSIADDVAWLAAHPTRRSDSRSNSEAMAKTREFKIVLRQRIQEAAAARNLSEDDIRPALTLKHQELARFAREHAVDLEWLLANYAAPIARPASEPADLHSKTPAELGDSAGVSGKVGARLGVWEGPRCRAKDPSHFKENAAIKFQQDDSISNHDRILCSLRPPPTMTGGTDQRIAVAHTAPPARSVTPAMKIAVSIRVISQLLRMARLNCWTTRTRMASNSH